jgi:hypothetical protein
MSGNYASAVAPPELAELAELADFAAKAARPLSAPPHVNPSSSPIPMGLGEKRGALM